MVEHALEWRKDEHLANEGGVVAVAVADRDLICTLANAAFCALLELPAAQVLRRPLTTYSDNWFGRALSQVPFRTLSDGESVATYASNPTGDHRVQIACSAGSTAAPDAAFVVTATRLTDALPPAQWLAYTTHLERSVMAGQHAVDRSLAAATGLRNLLFMSISNRPLEEMLDYVYEQAQNLLGAVGMVVLWAPAIAGESHTDDRTVDVLYKAGVGMQFSVDAAANASLFARFHESPTPLVLSEAVGAMPRRGAATSLLVPLHIERAVCGVVIFDLATPTVAPGAEQDARWLADQVIVAHGADRLQQKAKTATDLQERERLAREMHDAAMQSIYSITLFAEAGRRLASLGQIDRVQDYLQRLNETAQLALKELRLLLYELQPAVLEQVGLVGALRQRLESVERRTGMTARLEVDGDIDFPAFMEDGLYRICQEALNNALKHASASEVRVYLGVHAGNLKLEICDNGIGFDANDPKIMSGEGMTTMRERVRLMHARLFIESAPQQGACVRVLMAIPSSADLLFDQSGLPIQGGAK